MRDTLGLLIVDDERIARYGIRKALEFSGEVFEAADLATARRILQDHSPAIVLLDLNLGGENGLDLLPAVKASEFPPLVIIITAHGSERIAVEAMKAGAHDYLTKPFELEDLRLAVRNAAERALLQSENRELRRKLEAVQGFGALVGAGDAMRRVFSLIEKVAHADVPILISGESGTGKELVAQEIHRRSPRSSHRLVTVNCAAIPENLIESELFGHEKGAFTGAQQRRAGKFEQAEGGTLFLDEIGDMPLGTQAKILRVLEDRRIERLGGCESLAVDVRVISASHRNLKQMVDDGEFRLDLFYRLEVVRIEVPPLRNRREDIPVLVGHFLELLGKRYSREDLSVTRNALARLSAYNYPGNVRELRNILEKTVVLATHPVLDENDLPDEIRRFDPSSGLTLGGDVLGKFLGLPYKQARESFEKSYLIAKLAENGHNITHAAEAIGIHRQSLQQKIKDLGLKEYVRGRESD